MVSRCLRRTALSAHQKQCTGCIVGIVQERVKYVSLCRKCGRCGSEKSCVGEINVVAKIFGAQNTSSISVAYSSFVIHTLCLSFTLYDIMYKIVENTSISLLSVNTLKIWTFVKRRCIVFVYTLHGTTIFTLFTFCELETGAQRLMANDKTKYKSAWCRQKIACVYVLPVVEIRACTCACSGA